MENTIFSKVFAKNFKRREKNGGSVANLSKAKINQTYVVKKINTMDNDIINFLFTLGCYEGERVTVISKLADNFVISVKDARYSIDKELAEAIVV